MLSLAVGLYMCYGSMVSGRAHASTCVSGWSRIFLWLVFWGTATVCRGGHLEDVHAMRNPGMVGPQTWERLALQRRAEQERAEAKQAKVLSSPPQKVFHNSHTDFLKTDLTTKAEAPGQRNPAGVIVT